MLDPRFVEENLEAVAANCRDRNVPLDPEPLAAALRERREGVIALDGVRRRQNEVARLVTAARSKEERAPLIQEGRELKERAAELEEASRAAELRTRDLLSRIPNMTHPSAPVGRDESENRVIGGFGEPRRFAFAPRDHLDLGRLCHLIDMEAGAQVAGARFYFLRHEAVFLELALCRYALEVITRRGYQPNITPDLARSEILEGIGFIPRGEETQIYSIRESDLCLIATAEITLGGSLADRILEADELPLRLGGLSHCFRTEAGAPGRASRGLYRVHQFTKVEMFAFARPEDSETLHEEMREIEEEIFRGLGIPYRVVDICTGDLGGPAYRKYDLEAWMPSRGQSMEPDAMGRVGDWGEVTSASNCTDYQARRLGIRFRREQGARPEFVHTLNGTAVACSRALVAILENYQQPDGSIEVPDVLKPLVPFERIAPRS